MVPPLERTSSRSGRMAGWRPRRGAAPPARRSARPCARRDERDRRPASDRVDRHPERRGHRVDPDRHRGTVQARLDPAEPGVEEDPVVELAPPAADVLRPGEVPGELRDRCPERRAVDRDQLVVGRDQPIDPVQADAVGNAAEAGIEEAIVSIRTALDAAAAPQVYEIPTCGWSSNLNGVDVRVDCTRAVNAIASTDGDVIAQHNVVFVACLDTGSACDTDTPVIRAQVNFEKKFTDAVTKTYIQSWSVFG